MRVVAALLLASCALPIFWSQRGPTAKKGSDWAIAAATQDDHATPGDVVISTKLWHKKRNSTRKMAMGYPLPNIVSLRDLTLGKTAAEKRRLWSDSVPLAQAINDVGDAGRIWVVMDTKIPLGARLDVTGPILLANGYQLTASWMEQTTSVYEFEKRQLPPTRWP